MYHSRFKGSHYEAGYKWSKKIKEKLQTVILLRLQKKKKILQKNVFLFIKNIFLKF